ncbi:MAG: TetR/AcrR family transcriptional regulator [Saprospiraceae bacterium]|nr:TetR/AcrR family transcriptional regulator [Saprospiraceae bacterium]
MNTEEKILSKALEMFNHKGIEYVGMRELAAALEIRVSNITYYFPKKDDLVNQLSLDLNKLNSQIVVDDKELTIETFLGMFQLVFRNHIKYRCLLLSFVHLMEQNKKISIRYKKTQSDRNATLRSNLKILVNSGYLKVNDDSEIEFLVSAIALIVRFWISEATVSLSHLKPEEQISHYVSMIGRLLSPYLTVNGRKQLQKVLNNLNDALSS